MFGAANNKPSGMEQMVAKMLGFTPEQMNETIQSFKDTIIAVGEALKRVEEKEDKILAMLEAMQHERSERIDNGSGGNARRRTRNGNAGQRDGTADPGAGNGTGDSI